MAENSNVWKGMRKTRYAPTPRKQKMAEKERRIRIVSFAQWLQSDVNLHTSIQYFTFCIETFTFVNIILSKTNRNS